MTQENTLCHPLLRDSLYFRDVIASLQRTVVAANCNGPINSKLENSLPRHLNFFEIQSFKLLFGKQRVMLKCLIQTLQNIQKSSFDLTSRV